jgi:cyclopropane-fatty-acyl-phospholipid synthase
MAPLNRLYHFLRKNTLEGSRKNILAHYDLGNEFYRLFLDETMTYSCGIFEGPDSSLREASVAKYDRICRKLQLEAGDRVLEIGSGWGGFAIHAVTHYGCRVTATTISERQYDLSRKRFAEAGVSDRVALLKRDYRDLAGSFDKIVSIEMIEAVGPQYLDTFFNVCSRCLEAHGMMLLQAITIADWAYERYIRDVDFIKRYIFPGGSLPSVAAMTSAAARATDMRLFHMEDITPHYAATLQRWRENFLTNVDRVRSLGFPEPFIRMWKYYFCYCEGGFRERYIGDVQMLFTKPLCRRNPILPPLTVEA